MYVTIVCMCNILKPVLTYFNKQTLRQMKIPTSSFSCLWNVLLQNKNKKIVKERYYKALIMRKGKKTKAKNREPRRGSIHT